MRDDGFRFRCELIGCGREEDRLRRRIEALRLEDKVRLLPWHPTPCLRRDYARASVLAVPSVVTDDGDRDNIPNVVVEALACEVPVVASSLPALERLLGPPEAARLVPPGAPRALADALRQVSSDPAYAGRLRANGRRLVLQLFDDETNARRLRELLEGGSRAPDTPAVDPWEPSGTSSRSWRPKQVPRRARQRSAGSCS